MGYGTPDIPADKDELIHKEVLGTITEPELRKLVKWMYESPENWALYTARKAEYKNDIEPENSKLPGSSTEHH